MKLLAKNLILVPFVLLAFACNGQALDADAAVARAIMTDYQLDSSSYEIEILSNRLESTEVDSDGLTYSLISRKEPVGLFTVMVTIDLGDGEIDRGQVRMRISKFAEVLVTSDRIRRHDELTESNLIIKRMNITNMVERPILLLDELAGFRAKRNVGKDKILTSAAVEPVPDIEVGGEVTIVIADQLMQITAPGRCLQAGSTGDVIKVKNKATGKILKARVVDANSVAMDI